MESPPKITARHKHVDAEGNFLYKIGADLTKRYKIIRFLGEGTFGVVLKCWDRNTRSYVAIKVIKAQEKYTRAARIEVDILEKVTKQDPLGNNHCIRLLDAFDYEGQPCLVFDEYGQSLYDIVRHNRYRGFPLDVIRDVGRQLVAGVKFLHEELNLIHTDLKLENILFKTTDFKKLKLKSGENYYLPLNTQIVIIDMGSATFATHHHSSLVCTRHYRPPEVVLGLGWSYPVDIWSIGCILYEMYTGTPLFLTHDNIEHLAMMQKALGDFRELLVKNPPSASPTPPTPSTILQMSSESTTVTNPILPQKRTRSTRTTVTKTRLVRPTTTRQKGVFDPLQLPVSIPHHRSSSPDSESNTRRSYSLIVQHTSPPPNQHIFPHYHPFFVGGQLDWPHQALTKRSIRRVTEMPRVDQVLADVPELLDLVLFCLRYPVKERATCADLLRHPFFQDASQTTTDRALPLSHSILANTQTIPKHNTRHRSPSVWRIHSHFLQQIKSNTQSTIFKDTPTLPPTDQNVTAIPPIPSPAFTPLPPFPPSSSHSSHAIKITKEFFKERNKSISVPSLSPLDESDSEDNSTSNPPLPVQPAATEHPTPNTDPFSLQLVPYVDTPLLDPAPAPAPSVFQSPFSLSTSTLPFKTPEQQHAEAAELQQRKLEHLRSKTYASVLANEVDQSSFIDSSNSQSVSTHFQTIKQKISNFFANFLRKDDRNR
ncbi:putative serine/threonine protein kinase [Blattamonas nauphoetae]|uniref:Serine/threonine protein kinase n=1 Tax=Blattamonas nauphoetae TaxID=2049346 RepID=A0ABQ9Y5Y6_9EUKA|nr:putative serine/threonine protein kinase [Blattamonas nauphoetae]